MVRRWPWWQISWWTRVRYKSLTFDSQYRGITSYCVKILPASPIGIRIIIHMPWLQLIIQWNLCIIFLADMELHITFDSCIIYPIQPGERLSCTATGVFCILSVSELRIIIAEAYIESWVEHYHQGARSKLGAMPRVTQQTWKRFVTRCLNKAKDSPVMDQSNRKRDCLLLNSNKTGWW